MPGIVAGASWSRLTGARPYASHALRLARASHSAATATAFAASVSATISTTNITPKPTSRLTARPSSAALPRSMIVPAPAQRAVRNLATAAPSSAVVPTMSPLEALPPGFEVVRSRGAQSSSATAATTAAADAPPPYALFTRDLERSTLDDRQYRIICLANGLEAMLIHDPTTDKSSAAMDIRVGHLSDPKDFQGLAHFCEHLLFMGTEKYPRENEYSEFLQNHSGSSNAYTGMDNTNYFFDVGHSHLEGALDRFSQFFISPLFDPSCTEREIRAVDSEHKKNLQSDSWRAFQLEKSLSDPSHPYSHFGTGSAKTLWDEPRQRGQDVRDELLRFHDRYYSANVMKLVILGRESLDQLTDWTLQKFSGVRNKGLAAPTFPFSPLGKEQMSTQVFFRTVKDIRSLDITFPIPDQGPLFRAKPGQFLSHFIGHEGQGSILSHLKSKGWSNHLSAGGTNGADGFEFFKVSVDLTKEGLQNYQQVVATVFRYIELLKQSSIPEWTYNEVSSLCDLSFRFREKVPPSSYTSGLSSQMQISYPREWVLSGPFLTREFDQDLIRKTLACLSPERCRISIAAQECPDGSKAWDSKEKWYGTEYKLTPLPTSLLTGAAAEPAAFEDLALPNPNNFIPQNLDVAGLPEGQSSADVKAKLGATKRPVLLRHSALSRLWHKTDDRFFMPKANVFTLLRSPLIDATPANAVKTRVFVDLLKDALTEYSYDAELAGLGYNIEAQADGVGVSVDGYNDKLPVLLSHILKAIKSFQVDPARFEIVKDSVSRGYENFRLEAPYQHANYYTTSLMMEKMWTPDEKLKELKRMQADDVQRYIPDLLARLHIEMLTHGNLTAEQSTSLMDTTEEILACQPLSPSELIADRSLILPVPSNTRWTKEVPHPENVNSSIELYCQVGDSTDARQRATLSLLSQMASEPVFDQLRTKEQLGYLVFSSARKSVGSMGFRVLVQSERDAAYLESRIEAFFEQFRGTLEKMSDEEFQRHRTSLVNKKLEVVKNLGEESTRFWYHIHSGYYDFLQRDVDVAELQNVTRKDVMEMFMRHIHPSSRERAKLAVYIQSQVKPRPFSVEAARALQAAFTPATTNTTNTTTEGASTSSSPSSASASAFLSEAPQPPQEAWDMLLSGNSSVDAVKDFVRESFTAAGVAESVLSQTNALVDSLAEKYPPTNTAPAPAPAGDAAAAATSSAAQVSQSGNEEAPLVEVDPWDPTTFKAGLTPSRAAQPVRKWEEFMREPERCEPQTAPPSSGKDTIAAGPAHL